MVSVVAGSGNAKPRAPKAKPDNDPPVGKSLFDQMGLGPTEQGKRGGLGGIINFFSSKNSGSDPASVKARKAEDDRVATATTALRKQNNSLYHGPKGGASLGDTPQAVPPAVGPTKRPNKPVRKTATTTTVVPTKRPEPAVAATKSSGFRGVQSWRGGDVPGQVRYDPGTKPNPTKKQRAAGGGAHDTKGLSWFK